MFAMFCGLSQVVSEKLGGSFGQNTSFAVAFDSGIAPLNPIAYNHGTTTNYNVCILSKAALMPTHPCPSCNASSNQAHTSHCSLHIFFLLKHWEINSHCLLVLFSWDEQKKVPAVVTSSHPPMMDQYFSASLSGEDSYNLDLDYRALRREMFFF